MDARDHAALDPAASAMADPTVSDSQNTAPMLVAPRVAAAVRASSSSSSSS